MHLHNSAQRYGSLARQLHWAIAALMIFAFVFGLLAEAFEQGDRLQSRRFLQWHNWAGAVVLLAAVPRFLWNHWWSPAPPLRPVFRSWEAVLARAIHFLLYVLMIGLPVTGIVLMQARGQTVDLFGLDIPQFIAQDRPTARAFGAIHNGIFKLALIVIFALHVAGGVKHWVMERGSAGARRMVGGA